MKENKFSVLIPVYNCENYIEFCVDSVLKQTYGNFEIIIVDDGSTDNSAKVCDSLTDERIRVFHKENEGPIPTRLFAISKAVGDYCVTLDSDDYVDADYLESINEIINEDNCDMVVCSYRSVSSKAVKEIVPEWNEKKVLEGSDLEEYRKRMILSNHLNSLWAKIIKTELLKNYPDEFSEYVGYHYGEDLLLSMHPVFNAEKIVYVPKAWYNYRVNESSITHTVNPERYKSHVAARKWAYRYFEKSSFFTDENRRIFAAGFIKSMMTCVKILASSDYGTDKTICVFKDIAADEFFRMNSDYCDKSLLDKKTRILYELFSKKQYKILISVVRKFSK